MLGTRTKQVSSYGKRSKRIINISDDLGQRLARNEDSALSRIQSFDKQENLVQTELTVSSPDVPLIRTMSHKHKHIVPSLSPKKKTLVRSLRRPGKVTTKKIDPSRHTPSRLPLALYSPNTGSPIISANGHRKMKSKQPRSPIGIAKPFVPFVDMDIIVLDDKGRRISHEKRVSKQGVQVNPVVSEPKQPAEIVDLCESEEEIIQPARRGGKRRGRRTVVSDGSDEDFIIDISPPKISRRSMRKPRSSVKKPVIMSSEESDPQADDTIMLGDEIIPEWPPASHSLLSDANRRRQNGPNRDFQKSRMTTYHPPSPPIGARPRQLTPIRRRPFPRPPPTSSPGTPSSIGLSLDFDNLSLTPSLEPEPPEVQPAYLLPLLEECEQERPHEFSAFIEMFPFDPIVHSGSEFEHIQFRKIGEASYSEVFGIGGVVLKVIPICQEDQPGSTLDDEKDGPPPSNAKDVLKEMIVTRAMGDICSGFVKLLRGYVVRGRYPSLLLDLWDEYAESKGSESIRPDTFQVSQVYAIIVLPNGGPDLEAYSFTNASKMGWRQACSIFWQVTKSLARAEELVSFEHRDLHWGQILVKNVQPVDAPSERNGKTSAPVYMDHPSHGIRATLIDLGLARMDAGDRDRDVVVHWTPLDDEIFEGEGDYQFDVYRMMRSLNGGNWEMFSPWTNAMWLHYLSVKLLQFKRLKPPVANRSNIRTGRKSVGEGCRSEKQCWEAMVEIERELGECLKPYRPKKKAQGRPRKKPVEIVKDTGLESARAVREWGIHKGWIGH